MTPVLVADHAGRYGPLVAASGRRVVPASDRAEALRVAARERPALAVVAADLPPEGGVSLTARLVTGGTRVVLAATGAAPPVRQALHAGARSVVDPFEDELGPALAAAARGDLLLGRTGATLLPELCAVPSPPFPDLTPREREVLRELAADHDLRYIARHLGLTVKTVRHHLDRILVKTGAPDAVVAGRLARSEGLAA